MVPNRNIARCRALIAADEIRIAKQMSVIARLHGMGEDTSMSERLLANYKAALAGHQHELSAYERHGGRLRHLRK